jgi:hypothetical protein
MQETDIANPLPSEEVDINAHITGLSPELVGCFTDILRNCENEDQGAYWALVQKWTRLEYYFNNIVGIFWDASSAGGAGSWRIPDWDQLEEEGDIEPRIIAIYRAHAEAIIAALSVDIPSIVFFPDDADEPMDIEMSQVCSDIASLIQKHIKSPLLFMRALTILFNQGTVFAYSYYKTDPRFGIKHKPVFEAIPFIEYDNVCPQCGTEFGATPEPVTTPIICETCQGPVVPESIEIPQEMQIQTGTQSFNKGQVMIDLFDPRSVKVSIYAKEITHCGYLLLTFNQNVAMIRAEFNDNKISAHQQDDTLQWARNSTNYLGQFPDNVANIKCLWLRPWQFRCLGDGKDGCINELLAKYPKGCYAIFVNDELKYAVSESLDDHWTISQSPLSSFIHGEPLGTNLATVQDIQAEVDELELQTMEHGIPETFVKPSTLDLDLYKQGQARPGSMTPTLGAEPGEALAASFHQTNPAMLSSAVEIVKRGLREKAEFTTGSFPSIYGGANESGGGTAFEYKKSNANALQRLGITWKVVSEFWSELVAKSTFEFINYLEEDEKYTEKEGTSFRNIDIKLASLKGKIGRVEPEYSGQLPITWEQINNTLTQLLTLNNPAIESVLFNPNNTELIKKGIGLPNLYIPGEEARTKQYAEFLLLSQSPPMGNQPSVMPEIIDDHEAEMRVLEKIMTSPRGQKLKYENPDAYLNCMLHWQFHQMMLPAPEEETDKSEKKSKDKDNG